MHIPLRDSRCDWSFVRHELKVACMPQELVQIRLEFCWQHLGQVRNGTDDLLQFPTAPRKPGLYRFRFVGNEADRNYVGETVNLRRRLQHYRSPSESQQTNIRMNAELHEHVTSGGSIDVDIVTDGITVSVAGDIVPVDLRDKAMRRLLENSALVDVAVSGTALLNL